MIRGLTASLLLCTVALIHTMDIPLQMPLTVAELGDDLTLTCLAFGELTGLFYWYKMKAGHMIQTIARGSFHEVSLQGHFNNPRFSVTTRDSMHHLSIQNLSKQDEAAYFCQSGAAYVMTFTNATSLVVNEHFLREAKSRENISGTRWLSDSPLFTSFQKQRAQRPVSRTQCVLVQSWIRRIPSKHHPHTQEPQ
ncbi:uncharacterized protein V6R79_003625 [Siganus canaliculatus]